MSALKEERNHLLSSRRLRALLNRVGRPDLIANLSAESEPCYVLFALREETRRIVGCTRLGGDPDLSSMSQWPSEDGAYFTFLAQLNLAQLPRFADSMLPPSGYLHFFLGPDEQAFNIPHRVIFSESEVFSRRARPPNGLRPIMGDGSREFQPATLTFSLSVSPRPDSELEDFLSNVDASESRNLARHNDTRVLGFPQSFTSDSALEAHLCMNGMESILFYTHLTPDELQKQITQAFDHGSPQLAQHLCDIYDLHHAYHSNRIDHREMAKEWILLFRVGSHLQLGMCWWDAGAVGFMIRREDLLNRRFDRTYCFIDTS